MLRKIAAFLISASMVLSCLTINPVFAAGGESVNANESADRIVAFPGAEGGGMYATGARGFIENGLKMEVYRVTSLEDSGEGTFRDAVSRGNRIIVFDISGMIDLKSNITIGGNGKNNVTILGQTAPGDGICFRGNNIKISGENIIVRYLRFRVGDKLADGTNTKAQDGLEVVDDTKNVIIDHCSVSWGTDENLTAYAVKDVTIQNCIIAEALNQSVHDKGEHSYAAIWGGINLSVHHNIIATHKSRNPKIGTSETTAMTAGYQDKDTVVDIRNNIIYNWGDKAGYGSENEAQTNIINNWYKPGPATPEDKRARIFEYSTGKKHGSLLSGKVYANGNYIDDDMNTDLAKANAAAVNENNYQPDLKTGVYPDSSSIIAGNWENLSKPVDTYINDYPITTTTAKEAYDYVIANAGARLPKFDIVDQRIVSNVVNRTAPENGSHGSKYLVDSPIDGVPAGDEANYDDRGYPKFSNDIRESSFDNDGDGIADTWEDKMGLDKTNSNDSLNIGPGGYTWLEIYAESIGENGTVGNGSDGEITVSGVNYNNSKNAYEVNYTYTAGDGKTLKGIEYYSNGDMIKSVEPNGENMPADYNVINLPAGENYVTVKLVNTDGTYALSKTNVVYTAGENYSGNLEVSSDASSSVSESNGNYYMYASNGSTASLSKKDITDDFTFVVDAGKISNLLNGAQTGVSVTSESGEYVRIYKTYEDGKVVLKVGKSGSADETVNNANTDTYWIDMIKVSKSGDDIVIQAGTSAAFLSDVAKVSFANDLNGGKLTISAYTTAPAEPAGKETISVFNSVRFIDASEITNPSVKIINIKNNERIDLSSILELEVTPDSKAEINEIAVFLGDDVRATLETSISEKQTISLPVKFLGAAEGALRVVCFDKNLGKAEATVNVVVSDDIAPWKLETIGKTEGDVPSYIGFTRFYSEKNDYTYKIYSPNGGNISGTSDKYGYMYQKFNDDMRIYYRSRVQSSKNFGIMLKDSLEPNGVSYFFGCEPDGESYKYVLKARTDIGGEYKTISAVNLSGANNYIIAEKDGNKLRFYSANINRNIIDKDKVLLAETEIPFGDEYFMGFAATEGAPDVGWLTLESIERENEQSYKWNMNYGLDWFWQSQEVAVLAPEWTDEEVGGRGTGKMVISPDDDYSEKFIIREYSVADGTVESGFDIFVTGENPGIDFYLQTALGSAYKVGFQNTDEGDTLLTGGNPVIPYSLSSWYSVKITTRIGENTADISVFDSEGNVVSEQKDVEAVDFPAVNNVENKQPIKQGFFIKPLNNTKGTYYIDNMYVSLNARSSLEKAVKQAKELNGSDYTEESWAIVEKAVKQAEELLNNENAGQEELTEAYNSLVDAIASLEILKGEIAGETILWNFSIAPFDALGAAMPAGWKTDDGILEFESSATIDANNKTFDGIKFSKRIKVGTNHIKLNVPGKCDITVYALSASSSAVRQLNISDGTNTKSYEIGSTPVSSEFSYEGTTPTTIDIYGTAGLNYYGIKYTPYIVIDRTKTGIKGYDKTTGIAKVHKADDGITNAVMGIIVTDNNGKVVEFKKQNVQFTNEAEQDINIGTVSTEGNIKIFLWESVETMKPIGKTFIVE